MNKLKILIVEDDLIIALDISETLKMAGHQIVAIARNYQEAVEAVKKEPPDLAILDIRLEDSAADGIVTAAELLRISNMPIIYLTASGESETFNRAKETFPAMYLLKPFRSTELVFIVDLAYSKFQEQTINKEFENDFIFLPIDKSYVRVKFDDIEFIEAEGAYSKIYLSDTRQWHLLSMNIGYLSQYLPKSHFFRLSRSILVNLNHVKTIGGDVLFTTSNQYLPISKGTRKQLLDELKAVSTNKRQLFNK